MDFKTPAAMLCGLALVGAMTADAQASGRSDAEAARLSDSILAALIEANGVPGMGAAIERDGRIVWTGSAGRRDVAAHLPVDADTRFRLASVSKLITVAAAARLSEQGKLDIDAPVRNYVGDLARTWPSLTTRQLAAHTSGMPHYQDADDNRGGHRYASVGEAVGIFKDRPLLSAPGEVYSYSSWGYTLMSAVIEARAGRPFLTELDEGVTAGLEIGADTTDSSDPTASKAYDFRNGQAVPTPPHDLSYTWAGGGLSATPKDLARFGGRMLRGETVSAETFAWMLEPARLNNGQPVGEGDYRVGFGWRTGRDLDGARIAHHAGGTYGARSVLVLYPERKLSVSVLSNASWSSSIEQTAVMLAAPFQPPPAGLTKAPCPTAATTYAGQFRDAAVAGTARFERRDGACTGAIGIENGAVADWLNGLPQRDAKTLAVIGLDADGGLSRAALVTPAGIYDLRATGKPGEYAARIGTNRTLTLTLTAAR